MNFHLFFLVLFLVPIFCKKTKNFKKQKKQKFFVFAGNLGILKLGFLKCLKDEKIDPQEIIEFPCLKICTKTFEVVSEFHYYVQPIHHSELSNFCTELTGITQDMVKDQPVFSEVFDLFQTWLSSENTENFALVTCGDWDLNTCLEAQCQLSKIPFPKWAKSWINLKKSFQK